MSSQLILVSGLGSVIGPLIGTNLMARFSIDGLLHFMADVALLLAVLAAARSLTTASPQALGTAVRYPRAVGGAARADPRDDEVLSPDPVGVASADG